LTVESLDEQAYARMPWIEADQGAEWRTGKVGPVFRPTTAQGPAAMS
jgi:hypothetical protein